MVSARRSIAVSLARRRLALVALAFFVALGAALTALPAGTARAAADKLLIADNLNRRLLITDFDGRVVWKWDNPTGSSSAYAGPLGVRWMPGDRILATFGSGQVGLLDVATKTWVWKTSGYNGDWFQSPYDAELLPDGNLAVATRFNEGGRVTVYNRSTGAVVWKHLLSNAHAVHFRSAAQSYNSDKPTLLVGGWGGVREVEYVPGGGQRVAWSAKTEFTHDVIALADDRLLTTEGYYIQKIDRAGQQLWRKSTPDENRRIAVNPAGGYIYTVGEGDRIEFRDTNGNLLRSWSTLNDGTRLNYPYGIAVIDYGTATPPSGSTLFSDGFESGDFRAWSPVQTAGEGRAVVQTQLVRSGTYAARLSSTAAAGSYAYARASLGSERTDVTAAGDFRVVTEGAAGGNVPLLRLFASDGRRLVSLYRPNGASGRLWVQDGWGYTSTTGTLPLGAWGRLELHVVANGTASTIEVRLDGTTIYRTTAASLTSGVSQVQVGNDTAGQAFDLAADNVIVQG